MKKIVFSLFLVILGLYTHQANAQVILDASGSNFNVQSGTTIAVAGLEMTPSADFTLNTSITLATSISNTAAFPLIPMVYQFSQTTNPFTGTIKINYLDNELVGLGFTESTLKILYHDGTSWAIDNSSTNDAALNTTLSSTLSAKPLNELISGICLTSSSSIAMKLANQTTVAKLLTTNLHTWSITSGVDLSDFTMDSSSPQQLLFSPVANNASPQDDDIDNTYLVAVSNGCETQNLSISISPFCGEWSDIVSP